MDKSNSKAVGNLSKFFYNVILLSILLTSSSANGKWKPLAQALPGNSSIETTTRTQTTPPKGPELPLEEQVPRTPAAGVIEPIHAPFSMPQLKRPSFPDRTFSIADYGAKSGGKTKNTKAFANTIEACHKAGYSTEPIHEVSRQGFSRNFFFLSKISTKRPFPKWPNFFRKWPSIRSGEVLS